jgi:hypothetical protein
MILVIDFQLVIEASFIKICNCDARWTYGVHGEIEFIDGNFLGYEPSGGYFFDP